MTPLLRKSSLPAKAAVLVGMAAFGATSATLALMGAGVPFLPAAAVSAVAAGILQYAWMPVERKPDERSAPAPLESEQVAAAAARLDAYRAHTGSLRHDLRGVLSPALMMSDRLLSHSDPAVQRAGQAVVRSIDRATAILADSKRFIDPAAPPATDPPPGG